MNSVVDVADSAWGEPAWQRDPVLGAVTATSERGRRAALAADHLLHHRFVTQVTRTPEAVAVVAVDRTLSYAQLADESARVACRLAAGGTGPGALVGVVMEKGWEQVVGCLGVLRSGAAYVPVDPGWPADRVARVLDAAGVGTVLTQPWLRDRVEWPGNVDVLHVDLPAPGDSRPQAPDVEVGPQDLAYVIYTSGSTGVPKGVMIEHGSAVNTVLDVNDELSLSSEDRVLALSALNFDLSVYDMFGPLSVGAAVVLPASGDQREPGNWLALMTASAVTVWNSVPALMAMLCEHLASAPEGPGTALPPLRAVLMSGDWIPVTLPGEVWRHFPDAAQWSLGGATEAAIWSIWHRITPADASLGSVPYGTSMRGQRVFVADGLLRPRPRWVSGEICIAGAGVARGYLGEPELTARSFVVSPTTGERVYRTGDWGRLLPSGEIEFLGREDMQVKVGGYRIELGDVEAALLGCPGVAGVVVNAHGTRGRTRLGAHVLIEAGAAHDAADIRRMAGEVLPRYMVPADVTVWDAFPLTGNGKVDRAALARARDEESETEESAPPANADEELLLSVWRTFFDVPGLSVLDNFFELGGDSLRAVRLMSVLRRETGVELPVATLFAAPTIRGLARELRQAHASAPRSPVVPVRTGGTAVPLVFVHPIGGDVLCYSELARRLGDDQPFYAVQAPEAREGEAAPGLLDMAAAYARSIIREVPGERVRLGGWSMGGLLAIETARALRRLGRTVDLVAAVDVIETPDGLSRAPHTERELLAWLGRDLAGLTGRPWRPADATASPDALYTSLATHGILPGDLGLPEFREVYARFARNARALYGYRPTAFDGPVSFLQAESGADADAVEGWRALCQGGFEHIQVPGDHYTVLRAPNVDVVAETLTNILR
ncbi:amino acid adenylation domain-containing protein [Streptomyces alkaliterrae]|uniref:amino acid adenylation domain-containing protein n=1 Tax=Streptomyces alkaliterrae TaxID=2213162 RepID=UPI002B1F8EB1|nr:amino acid adenylation domain-containing protein [Streptomyces alkaliterrae]